MADPEAVADGLRRELLAIAALGREQPRDALARCTALLTAQPGFVPALCLAAHLERRLGDTAAAWRHLQAALERDPGAAPALSEASQLSARAGDWGRARDYLLRLTRKTPGASDAWFNLGLAEEHLGRYEAAAQSYERTLSLDPPGRVEILVRRAGVLAAAGREEEAEAGYRAALAEDPDHPDAHFGAGLLAVARGDLAAGDAAFRRAVDLRPAFAEAWQQLLESRRIEDPADPDLAAVRALLESGELDPTAEAPLRYAVAKACDDLGRYDEAFEHYRRANALKRARLPAFDRAACERDFDRLIEGARRARPPAPSGGPPTPVFIVGMPRSGTTLVDQFLTAHPEARGVGEQPWFERAARAHSGEPGGAALSEADRQGLAARCREALRAAGGTVVTNKFPGHFRHVGLILDVLPEARILHVRRDPLDTCLSIYCQDFPVGNLYANDLEDIACFFRGYRSLMDAWRETLGDRMLDVHYQALLDDPAGIVAAMLDFVGLPWDDACLDHAANARPVGTLSRWQVRQPLYRGSVGRWRHYEASLAPLITALA